MDDHRIKQGKKDKVLMIKQKNLLILLLFALLIGSLLSSTLLYATILGPNYVSVKKTDYKIMSAMEKKYAKAEMLWNYIDQQYYIPADDKKLEEGMYKGLFAGLGDPYSGYMTKDEFKHLMESTSGKYEGVGVTMAAAEDGKIAIMAVTEGSASAKAGLKVGDHILKVDGKDYRAENMNEAAEALRGSSGTKVAVTVERNGKARNYELIRTTITTKSVGSALLDNNIGYIRIAAFDEQTPDAFKKELKKMEDRKVKGFVLDLRGNPGGVVESGVEVADMLMDAGVVTYTVDRQGEKKYYKTKDGKTGLPYVVLVNESSASTSEILAAAIKDRKGGKMVGTTTYGKGIIQAIQQLPTGEGVKMTVMQYFSPNGTEIHHKGVKPDYEVELKESDYDEQGVLINDRQLKKALQLLK